MSRLSSLRTLVRDEALALLTIQRSDRPWQLPFAAAIASGAPVAVGAWLGLGAAGALGAVAGLSFLYLPATGMHHRIPVIMACAFAMVVSYALGLASHLMPGSAVLIIGGISAAAMLFCKTQAVIPPGPIFMVMAASIAAFSPTEPSHAMQSLGLFVSGCIWACTVAVAYSAYILRYRAPVPPLVPSRADLHAGLVDSILIGIFVSASLALAAGLQLEKAYWVPVSCLAVMQGVTLRSSWSRNVHRITGTAIGLGLTWLLLPFLTDLWAIAAAVTILSFLIEFVVVRHYAFAAVFITPLTILLAESTSPGVSSPAVLMQTRLVDTIIGAMIGLVGAICIHNPLARAMVETALAAIRPRNAPR
jgi:hypothetical protein